MIVVDRREVAARWLGHLDHAPDGTAARLLAPLGALYAAGAAVQRRLCGEQPLPDDPPSIAIGNPRVGGTGKTPVVHDLGRRLVAAGKRVAVLSRGYRAEGGGDEPEWLSAAGLHVTLGRDRHASFEHARAEGADVVLLDDGLQTRARARLRLAIVLERDLLRPPRTLPAGPAREAVAAAMQRADGFLVRREAAEPAGAVQVDDRPQVGFRLAPTHWIDSEDVPRPVVVGDGPPCVAVSGLARPESFEATVRATGVVVLGAWRRPDHWHPTEAELREIEGWARSVGATALVCPEKNFTRLRALGPRLPLSALAAAVAWDVDDPLHALGISRLLGTTKGDPMGPPSS